MHLGAEAARDLTREDVEEIAAATERFSLQTGPDKLPGRRTIDRGSRRPTPLK